MLPFIFLQTLKVLLISLQTFPQSLEMCFSLNIRNFFNGERYTSRCHNEGCNSPGYKINFLSLVLSILSIAYLKYLDHHSRKKNFKGLFFLSFFLDWFKQFTVFYFLNNIEEWFFFYGSQKLIFVCYNSIKQLRRKEVSYYSWQFIVHAWREQNNKQAII